MNWKSFNKNKILWNVATWKTEERRIGFQLHYHDLSVHIVTMSCERYQELLVRTFCHDIPNP